MNEPQVIYPSVWASTEKYPIQRWQLDNEGYWWGERPNPDYAGFYITYEVLWKQLIDPVEYTGQDIPPKPKAKWYKIDLAIKSTEDPTTWLTENLIEGSGLGIEGPIKILNSKEIPYVCDDSDTDCECGYPDV